MFHIIYVDSAYSSVTRMQVKIVI